MVQIAAVVSDAISQRRPKSHPSTTVYVYLLTLMACLGGLLFGYDTGIVSSAMLYLPLNKQMGYLSTLWQELIISITPGMAGLSALIAGKSGDYFGRRMVILAASATFIVGAVLCGAAPERWSLFGGRVLLGVAIGFASMIIPVYIGEAAPSHIRGTLITIYQFMVAFGFVVANAFAAWFAHYDPVNLGWRLMFSLAAVPAATQFVCFLFLPETPRFIMNVRGEQEARKVLQKIYGGSKDWIDYEMDEITRNIEDENQYRKAVGDSFVISRILKTQHVRKAMLLGCAMQMFQQLAGINTILYYTGTIIRSSGVKDKITTIWISCAVSSVQAIGTFAPMRLIERLGRRVILISSLIGVVITLCLMGGAFYLIDSQSAVVDPLHAYDGIEFDGAVSNATINKCAAYKNCASCVMSYLCGFCSPPNSSTSGQCLPIDNSNVDYSLVGFCKSGRQESEYLFADNYCFTKFTAIPIVVMVVYILAYSFGMGPMPWVYNAEIYPLWARSTCVSLSTFTNWFFNLIISLTFLTLSEAITKYGAFFLYAGISFLGLVLFYVYMPETRGCQIEEVELLFMSEAARRHKQKIYEERARTEGSMEIQPLDIISA